MEHLPEPENPQHPPLEIPYLNDSLYDGQGFLGFATRRNWQDTRSFEQMWQTGHPQSILAMLQSWLYFGFLEAFFQDVWTVKFEKDDFVVRKANKRIVSSISLKPKYYRTFVERLAKYSSEQKGRLFEHAEHLLKALHQFFIVFLDKTFKVKTCGCIGSEEIPFSIAIIAETLQDLTVHATRVGSAHVSEDDGRILYKDHSLNIDWSILDLPRSRMLGRGWCLSEVQPRLDNLRVRAQYYLSNLGWRNPTIRHPTCSESQCAIKRFDEKTYKTIHRPGKCSCGLISVPEKRLEEVLKEGMIPRVAISTIKVDAGLEGEGMVEVVESGKYVAISHVWSHGMGNVNANAIHRCQFLFLQDVAQKLYSPDHPPVHIWLDTLCIPTKPGPKQIGLKLIRKAFSEADKVLAVDLELLMVKHVSMTEYLMRIVSSEWMTRMWTLEEAVVAGAKLYIQFSQHAINLMDLLQDRLQCSQLPKHVFPIWISNSSRDKVFDDLEDILITGTEKNREKRVARFFKVLHHRRTSRKSDEIICIASALDILSDSLVDAPAQSKMSELIQRLEKIPSYVLFSNAPRLTEPGFYWAPSSFLGGDLGFFKSFDTMDSWAEWTGSGIFAELSGFRLRINLKRFLKQEALLSFYFWSSEEKRWYYANLVFPEDTPQLRIPLHDDIVGFALATYPLLAQKRAILVALRQGTGDVLDGIFAARYNIGELREPLKDCAESFFRRRLEEGIELNPKGDSKGRKGDGKPSSLNARHHGLYSVGKSAEATYLSPLQKWRIG